MLKRLANLLQDTQLSLFGPEPVAVAAPQPVVTPQTDAGSAAGNGTYPLSEAIASPRKNAQ